MFGREYLDWVAETAAEVVIDAFLAAMEPEDRIWALAVLRKRHVTYKEGSDPRNLLSQLARNSRTNCPPLSGLALQQQIMDQRQSGGVMESIFGRVGRPFV